MWIAVELVFHHYIPDKITEGTLFMNHLYPGSDKETVEIFEIDQSNAELIDRGIIEIPEDMGNPVQPYILDDDGKVIATPDEIGQFDHPRYEDEYQPFTPKEMNIIMQDFDGLCEILIDPDELEEDNFIQPIYVDDKVILRGLTPDEEEQE
mgnify:FL=1